MERKKLIEMAAELSKRKIKLTLDRYKQIMKEWNLAEERFYEGKLSERRFSRIDRSFSKECRKAEVRFDNEKDFIEFTDILIESGAFSPESAFEIPGSITHEIEHSRPYQERGISSYFGWHYFPASGIFKPFHLAFGDKLESLSPDERAKLSYKSLKAVSELSELDKEKIERLERRMCKLS